MDPYLGEPRTGRAPGCGVRGGPGGSLAFKRVRNSLSTATESRGRGTGAGKLGGRRRSLWTALR